MFVFVRLCEYLISVSLFQSAVSSMKSLLMHSWHSKIVEEMYWIECCVCVCVCVLSSVQFFVTYGLQPVRPLCPWNCPGKNTEAGCHFLLQGIFPTQGSNPCLLRQTWVSCVSCIGRRILYPGQAMRRTFLEDHRKYVWASKGIREMFQSEVMLFRGRS